MMSMSIPYELNGRTGQKRRTRTALIAAARELVAGGATPTVDAAAEHASISRTTAYRYFPNQRALLVAAHPETAAASLLPDDAPDDAAARLDIVVGAFTQMIVDTEAQQRTMLRLSLEADPVERSQLPLRQGARSSGSKKHSRRSAARCRRPRYTASPSRYEAQRGSKRSRG